MPVHPDAAAVLAAFPDFDVSTLPLNIPASMSCGAWVNDACPLWWDAKNEVMLGIDYVCPVLREYEGGGRFNVIRLETSELLYAGNDWEAARAVLVETVGEG